MKHLIKVIFTLIAVSLLTTASAQKGAFIRYDLDGKTIAAEGDNVNSYNILEPGDEDFRTTTEHVAYVSSRQTYKLLFKILTSPKTKPVAGKLPYVSVVYGKQDPVPAAYVSLTKTVGDNDEHYGTITANSGYFEITKVADGWVEGKFEVTLPKLYAEDYNGALHITNGSFRFKIAAESKN